MPETVQCRDCGTSFNLDAQWYYDNLCPSCKAEQDGEEKTWPSCIFCGDKIPPEGRTSTTVTNRSMRGGSERVTVHEDCE